MEAVKEKKNPQFRPHGHELGSFFSPTAVQTKRKVNLPGNKYEIEADQAAEQVVQRLSNPSSDRPSLDQKPESSKPKNPSNQIETDPPTITNTSLIQTKCDACEAEERETLKEEEIQKKHESIIFLQAGDGDKSTLKAKSRKAEPTTVSAETFAELFASKGGGEPLPKNTRSEMERGFGVDLSKVRTHTDSSAVSMSKNLGAQAFTHGSDIYFNTGKFDTQSQGGKKLLAHELTHTIQQGAALFIADVNPVSPGPQIIQKQEEPNSLHEEEQDNDTMPVDETESLTASSGIIESNTETSASFFPNDETQLENNEINNFSADVNQSTDGGPSLRGNESQSTSVWNGTGTESIMSSRGRSVSSLSQSGNGDITGHVAGTEISGAEPLVSLMPQEMAGTSATSSGGESSASGLESVMAPYTDLVQWAELEKLNILQHTEDLKTQVLWDAEREKQAIVSLIESQVTRFKNAIQGAVDSVNLAKGNARVTIQSHRENKIREANESADIEIENLETLVSTKQDALTGIGEGIAGLITQHGNDEANRATTQSEANSGQISTIITQISTGFSDREGASDLESEVRSRSADMGQEFIRAGNDMAGQVRQDVRQMAIDIRGEASEASSQFNAPLEEGRNAINQKRQLTISDLETTGNDFLTVLDREADEIIAELRAQELQQEASIRQIGEGAFGTIDEVAVTTNRNLDIAGQQIVGELDQFILQLEEIGWHRQELADAQADIQVALLEHNQEVHQYLTEVTLKLSEHYSGIEQESNVLLAEIEAILTTLQTDFQTKLDSSVSDVTGGMDTIVSDSVSEMETVVPNLRPELDNVLRQSEEDWNSQLLASEADISKKVDEGLELQSTALSDLSSSLRSEFGDLPSKDRGFLESAWDVLSSIGEFVAGVVYGLFEGLGELLKGIWTIITTPALWLLALVVVIVAVIVIAIVAVVLGVKFMVAALIIGVVLGLVFAGYYIYQAITAEGLSPYDRGRLVGRGIFEGIMAFVGTGLIARLAAWSTRIAQLVNIVNKVGGLMRFLPILTKVDDVERLISLIARLDDAMALARLIDKVHDANGLLLLLDSASDANKIIVFLDRLQDVNLILSKVDDAATLIRIIDKVGDVAKFERVLGRVDDAGKLITLIVNADDAGRLLTFFDEVGDINRVLAKVDDAQTLIRLVGNTDNMAQLERLLLLDKITDAGQLERLLGLGKIDDGAQLERLLDLVDDGGRLERLLSITDNGLQLEGYLAKAGGARNAADLEDLMNKAVALGDFRRVEDLLNIANGNVNKFYELANALKNFDVNTAPGGTLSNLHGYSGANLQHFQARHTYEYFDFGDIKASNTLWSKSTDVATLVEEALTILDNMVPPRRLLPFQTPPVTVTLSNGITVQIGLNNANIIGQFFPLENRAMGVINFVRQEMNAFKKLLIP